MLNAIILCFLLLLLAYLLKSVYSNRKQRKLIQKEEDSIKDLENQNSAFF